ncbi:MAG: hypothetical protein H6502_01940 [Candidatus Woesearchaeota archaeon]|nr:MAG: hypothetical protein H6502_01940 [Candidatus Woesearchaeota archaeon]
MKQLTQSKGLLLGLLLLVSVLCVTQVSALTVSPAARLIDYAPGQTVQLSFDILNPNRESFKVSVYPTGVLSDAVKSDIGVITVRESDEKKTVSFSFTFPRDIEPGLHMLEMVILLLPESLGNGEVNSVATDNGIIAATTAVISQFRFNVPYPGKYLKAEVTAVPRTDVVEFIVSAMNVGTDPLRAVRATFTVLNPANEVVGTVTSSEISLPSKEEGKLTALWTPPNPGTYTLKASITYDGESLIKDRIFEAGSLSVELASFAVSSYHLGEIARIDLLVRSLWNNPIEELYAEVILRETNGAEVTSFKTPTERLPAFSSAVLKGFWDTKDILPGTYDFDVTLHYDGKVRSDIYSAVIAPDEVSLEKFGEVTGQVVGGAKESSSSGIGLIVVLVLIVLVSNVVIIFFVMRSRRKV